MKPRIPCQRPPRALQPCELPKHKPGSRAQAQAVLAAIAALVAPLYRRTWEEQPTERWAAHQQSGGGK